MLGRLSGRSSFVISAVAMVFPQAPLPDAGGQPVSRTFFETTGKCYFGMSCFGGCGELQVCVSRGRCPLCSLAYRFVSVFRYPEVHFCDLSPELIEAYVATGEPLDKAGAYGYQGGMGGRAGLPQRGGSG